MLIKAKIAWRSADNKTSPAFSAWYDNNDPLEKIARFYLDKENAEKLIAYLSLQEAFRSKVRWMSDHLVLPGPTCPLVIGPGTWLTDDDNTLVYEIDTNYSLSGMICFNVEWTDGIARYTREDMWEAILYTITETMASAFAGSRRVDGMSPQEFAWMYISQHYGNCTPF